MKRHQVQVFVKRREVTIPAPHATAKCKEGERTIAASLNNHTLSKCKEGACNGNQLNVHTSCSQLLCGCTQRCSSISSIWKSAQLPHCSQLLCGCTQRCSCNRQSAGPPLLQPIIVWLYRNMQFHLAISSTSTLAAANYCVAVHKDAVATGNQLDLPYCSQCIVWLYTNMQIHLAISSTSHAVILSHVGGFVAAQPPSVISARQAARLRVRMLPYLVSCISSVRKVYLVYLVYILDKEGKRFSNNWHVGVYCLFS